MNTVVFNIFSNKVNVSWRGTQSLSEMEILQPSHCYAMSMDD